jgi:addiction module HigA family antidote
LPEITNSTIYVTVRVTNYQQEIINKLIKSFIHKGLKYFFYKGTKKGINPNHADKLSDISDMLADTLKVSRKALSMIVNERKAVTTEMALRLSQAFDTTPDLWLNLQKNYDLFYAR